MQLFIFFVFMVVSLQLKAAEFQLPGYQLGMAKTAVKADVPEQTSLRVFEADAQTELQWQDDKLVAVQLSFYQGPDYATLRQKADLLLQQLYSQFGAVLWVSSEASPEATQSQEQQLALLDQVLKTAAETAAGYKQSHLANSTLVLDFQPSPQPDNSRLHLQVSFSSFDNNYKLVLFIDETAAAPRTANAIVNLEAF